MSSVEYQAYWFTQMGVETVIGIVKVTDEFGVKYRIGQGQVGNSEHDDMVHIALTGATFPYVNGQLLMG